jgi:hypothetical protein
MALSARAEPDNSRSLGYGRLILRGVDAGALSGGYRIRREGYQASNLGLRGWQVSEEILRPVGIEQQGTETVLILGPRMTRNMEPGPVHLVLPGLGEVPLFWPDSIEVFDGELPPDPVMPVEPVETLPAPTARPVELDEGDTVILRPPPPIASAPTPSPQRKSSVALYAGLGGLLLLLAAAFAWWWFADPFAQHETPSPEPVAVTPAAVPTPDPAPVPTPAPAPVLTPVPSPVPEPTPAAPPERHAAPLSPPAAVWPDGTDDLSLRDVVGRAANPAAVFAVALRRQAAGRHDDALVLLEESAAGGHAPAMTALGRLYDPNGFVAGQPFRTPDPRAAARQYAQAERAGDAAAVPLRVALRGWLQQQADGGNASAATTLREFW